MTFPLYVSIYVSFLNVWWKDNQTEFYRKGSDRPKVVNTSEFSILAARTGKLFLGFFFFLAALSIPYNPSSISNFQPYVKVFLVQTNSLSYNHRTTTLRSQLTRAVPLPYTNIENLKFSSARTQPH